MEEEDEIDSGALIGCNKILKPASKRVVLEGVIGGNKDHGSGLGVTRGAMHCLLEAPEGGARNNGLWKLVPSMGEARNKGVEVCQAVCWKFNQEGVTPCCCWGGSED